MKITRLKWLRNAFFVGASVLLVSSITITDPIKAKNTTYHDSFVEKDNANKLANNNPYVFNDGEYQILVNPFVDFKHTQKQSIGILRKNLNTTEFKSNGLIPSIESISYENTKNNEKISFSKNSISVGQKKEFLASESDVLNEKSPIYLENNNLRLFADGIDQNSPLKTTVHIVDRYGRNKFLNFDSTQVPEFNDNSRFTSSQKNYAISFDKNKTNKIEKILYFDCKSDINIYPRIDVLNINRGSTIFDIVHEFNPENEVENKYKFDLVQNQDDPKYYDLVYSGQETDFSRLRRFEVTFSIVTDLKVSEELTVPKVLKNFGDKTISIAYPNKEIESFNTMEGNLVIKPGQTIENIGRVKINKPYYDGMEDELRGYLKYSYNAIIYQQDDAVQKSGKPIYPEAKQETIVGANLLFSKTSSADLGDEWSVFDVSLHAAKNIITPSLCDVNGFTPVEMYVDFAQNYAESFSEDPNAPIVTESNLGIKFDLGSSELYFPNSDKRVTPTTSIVFQKNNISAKDVKATDANSYKSYTVMDENGNLLNDWSVTDMTQTSIEKIESYSSQYIEKLDSETKSKLFFDHLCAGQTDALKFSEYTWMIILEETIMFLASLTVIGIGATMIYGFMAPMAGEAFEAVKKDFYTKHIDAKVNQCVKTKVDLGFNGYDPSFMDPNSRWLQTLSLKNTKYIDEIKSFRGVIDRYIDISPKIVGGEEVYVYGDFLKEIQNTFANPVDREYMIKEVNNMFSQRRVETFKTYYDEYLGKLYTDEPKIFSDAQVAAIKQKARNVAYSENTKVLKESVFLSHRDLVNRRLADRFEKFGYKFDGKYIDSTKLMEAYTHAENGALKQAAVSDLVDEFNYLDNLTNETTNTIEMSRGYLYSKQYFEEYGWSKFKNIEYWRFKGKMLWNEIKTNWRQIVKGGAVLAGLWAVSVGMVLLNKKSEKTQLKISAENTDIDNKALYPNYRQRSLIVNAPDGFEGEKKIKIVPYGIEEDECDYIQSDYKFQLSSENTETFTYTSEDDANVRLKFNDDKKWISQGSNELVGKIYIDNSNKITKDTFVVSKILTEDFEKIDEKGWSIKLSGDDLKYRDFSIKVPATTKHANIKVATYYEDKNGELKLVAEPTTLNILGGDINGLSNTRLQFNEKKSRINSDLTTSDCFENLFKFESTFGLKTVEDSEVKVFSVESGGEIPNWTANLDNNSGQISVFPPFYFTGEENIFIEVWKNGELVWRSEMENVYRDRSISKIDYVSHNYLDSKPEKYFVKNQWNEIATYEACFYQGDKKISIFDDMDNLDKKIKISVREKKSTDKNCPNFQDGLIKDYRIVKISDTKISIQAFVPNVDFKFKLSNGFYYTSLLCEMEILYGDKFVSLPEISSLAPMYFLIK